MQPVPAQLSFEDFDISLLDAGPSTGSGFSIDAIRHARGTDRPGFTQSSVTAMKWLRSKDAGLARELTASFLLKVEEILKPFGNHPPEETNNASYRERLADSMAGAMVIEWARESLRAKPGTQPEAQRASGAQST
jgi:hypothetical protein